MNDPAIEQWFPFAFPFFFVGMWLCITTILGFLSGWFGLQNQFPDDGDEDALLKLGGQSGSMGIGVSMSGILKLRAYPSGLGVGISRLFGPFQKPLKIPWSEIEASSSSSFLVPMAKLQIGRRAGGQLKISARSWSKLVDAAQQSTAISVAMPKAERVSRRSTAQAMFLQWLVMTALAAAFFYLAPRLIGAGAGIPLGVAIGFPAVVFGIGQIVRYFRES
ncbi:hypothetical protein ACRAQ6_07000 [Erythrobacter sp. HA6-11]